jgi:AAA domain, putative AbiEii toxin, Type IV TA system
MISTLELQQFRGLEHVKFENLGRVNLIVGGNNVGKTSVLESLVLLCGNMNQLKDLPTTFRELPQKGDDEMESYWKLLLREERIFEFRIFSDIGSVEGCEDTEGEWVFSHLNSNGHDLGISVIFGLLGSVSIENFKAPFHLSILSTKQKDPAAISELYNRIAPLNPDNEEKLEELLRKSIEPRLRRLRYARPEGTKTHLVYVDLGEGKMIPFTQMGQAFARTLQVYCEIFAQRPKILLIDEIENGLYYEGMEDYWKGLMAVLEDQDVQLFATTHSRECMEAAYRAAKDVPSNPLRYLRLDRRIDDPAKIVATIFGKEEMATAIEFNREMR